jgi:GNAT superfamily N-acetyltransferase
MRRSYHGRGPNTAWVLSHDVIERPLEPADADAAAAMFNVIDAAFGRQPALTAAVMDGFITTWVVSPATNSRLVFEGDTLVAGAFVCAPPAGGHMVDLIGGVVPAARGQGIGRGLLDWQLTRAREIRAAAGASQPWEAHAEASSNDESALALLGRFGFSPVRYAFDMIAATRDLPDQAPPGLTIATYDADLAPAVHAAHVEAFADHWGFQPRPFEMWAPATVDSANFVRELSVVATSGAEVAGYVLAYNDAIADQVYIGQVGVRRPWRRQGLAGAMLARVLSLAAAAGRTTAALDVDAASQTGAVGVYERVGFQAVHTLVTCAHALD